MKKILIVDDSKAMRLVVRRSLRQAGLPAHEVVEAANGKEALDVIARENPDLVLSDWNMPEMNGIELLRTLKENGTSVSFGFITTEGTPEMIAKAINEGAMFLIAKPFTPEQLSETLTPVLK